MCTRLLGMYLHEFYEDLIHSRGCSRFCPYSLEGKLVLMKNPAAYGYALVRYPACWAWILLIMLITNNIPRESKIEGHLFHAIAGCWYIRELVLD